MSNVVTHSALTYKLLIKIIYNPFRHIFTQATVGMTASQGAVTRSWNILGCFLTQNPEENGVNFA